jgi:hypothetical protein
MVAATGLDWQLDAVAQRLLFGNLIRRRCAPIAGYRGRLRIAFESDWRGVLGGKLQRRA